MKEIKNMLLIIALILLMASGCGVKPEPTSDPIVPSENASSSTPLIATLDEKNYSMHSGELFAKNGNILIYADK